MSIKVALVHDYLNQWGGAERVLAAIAKIYPQAPVFTAIYDRKAIVATGNWKLKNNIDSSSLNSNLQSQVLIPTSNLKPPPSKIFAPPISRLPLVSRFYKHFSFLYPLVFESFDLSGYNVIISSVSNFAKGVITGPGQVHICYCHTVPRFLYHYPTEGNYRKHWFWGRVLPPLDNYLRIWDYAAAQRVDYFVANSQTTAARIKKFYGREARVIYPPVGMKRKKIDQSTSRPPISSQTSNFQLPPSYFLTVSRLSRYKNVDLIIRACNELKLVLLVVGDGPERARLQQLAGPTVHLVGRVGDAVLADYYRDCQALICAASDEDFGITPVEAMSFGKPVIALRSGGYLETVVEGKTGEFFDYVSPSLSELSGTLSQKTRRRVAGVNPRVGPRRADARGATDQNTISRLSVKAPLRDPFEERCLSASERGWRVSSGCSLKQVLTEFDPGGYDPDICRAQAQKFSPERFQKEFQRFVKEAVSCRLAA